MTKIAIEEATPKQLRYFAGTILGLEVAQTENGASLRSKIEVARPGLTEIDVPEEEAAPARPVSAAAGSAETATGIPEGRAGQHFSHDPRVRIIIAPTSDKTKPKDVQIAVGGDAILIQRGKEVDIPYRHYLALTQAKESVAVDLDEINPLTSMPRKEWSDQHSYPFSVLVPAAPAAIAAWQKRTAAIVMQ